MSVQSFSIPAINCKSSEPFRINLENKTRIALAVLGNESPTKIAEDYGISRMSVYRAKEVAASAIAQAFACSDESSAIEHEQDRSSEEVLVQIDITKEWIQSLVLSLILVCHSSYEGVVELIETFFQTTLSKGTIFNIIAAATKRAAQLNLQADLTAVKVGAHDEIFQCGEPVLVGCDVESTYCYLLKLEDSRDSTTWGVNLLDLSEKQGLYPQHTIGDGGSGLRKGQEEAWPTIPCYGDVFHAIKGVTDLCCYLEHRALGKISALYILERKMERAKGKQRGNALSKPLANAREKSKQAIQLYDDINILLDWLKKDILAVVGPDFATRQELLAFVVKELELREELCTHRIKPVRTFLQNQGEDLLRFVKSIEQSLEKLADEQKISLRIVREMYEMIGLSENDPQRWTLEASLRKHLGQRFHTLQSAVQEMTKKVIRASSVVENINSRLRSYFFLRKQLGPKYLELLQFYLNHHLFRRSRREERVGKSPAELLTGDTHDHWLTLLGFRLPLQAA